MNNSAIMVQSPCAAAGRIVEREGFFKTDRAMHGPVAVLCARVQGCSRFRAVVGRINFLS